MKRLAKNLMIGATFLSSLYLVGFSPNESLKEAQTHIRIKGNGATPDGYQPSQIKKAYGLNQLSTTGVGQTIAIVEAYGNPNIKKDLSVFSKQFNLPKADLQIVYPQGKPKKIDSGWSLETSLDVEWAHALAPDAKILLVIAKSASVSDLVSAVDYATSYGAQVVSMSWGTTEFSSETSYDSHFQHSGVVFVSSSGDRGSGVHWPASSPYVLSVGGTTLNIDSDGNYLRETAWSGSGGGISSYESRQNYQDNWIDVVGSYRGVPDVSWDADPNTGVAVYNSTSSNGQSGWFKVGGTSFGAPSWAAIIVLTNQERTSPLTSIDAVTRLYKTAGISGSADYITDYHDISEGSNGGYSAQAGYDLVTGIGTPQVNSLIPVLVTNP